jgi:phenylalanyl-tRNA synthetase beta chain
MTRSVVGEPLETSGGPWGGAAPLVISPALVRGADRLRRTLLPSLLEARAGNAAVGTPDAELFEIARAYVARGAAEEATPTPVEEPLLAAFVCGGGFARGKGLAEAVLARLGLHGRRGPARIEYRPFAWDLFTAGRGAEILLHDGDAEPARVGVVGEVAAAALSRAGLDGPVVAAELRLDRLEFTAGLDRRLERPSDFPAVQRDVNLVVDEVVPWAAIEAAIHDAAGALLDDCRLVQVWQDAERLGAGRKSLVVALRLRSRTGTLSRDEATATVAAVVAECSRRVGAVLRQ